MITQEHLGNSSCEKKAREQIIFQMDFVGFPQFALKCIDVFAWPVFALGYPLCASIRAIETNSNDHMRNLVAYWVLFSLISLFEHTSVKLIEWVPLWSYIKITTIFWLVIPRFRGAYYAYKILIHPRISVNLQVVGNLLNKRQESSLNTETFLAVAERYFNENGTEALEEFIANKVKSTDVNLVKAERKMVAAVEVKEIDTLPEKPTSIKVQKEWTCAVCQVTTNSETILKSHLQGKKHKVKCEDLKASKKKAQNKSSSSSSTTNKSNQANQDPLNCVSGDGSNRKKAKKWEEKIQVNGNGEQYKQKKPTEAYAMPKQYWCSICNVCCNGEIAMDSHLNGDMHTSRIQEIYYSGGVHGSDYSGGGALYQ